MGERPRVKLTLLTMRHGIQNGRDVPVFYARTKASLSLMGREGIVPPIKTC